MAAQLAIRSKDAKKLTGAQEADHLDPAWYHSTSPVFVNQLVMFRAAHPDLIPTADQG
jgi:hypothetical protein